MNLKQLLSLLSLFAVGAIFAQDGPSTVIQGHFVKKTMPLRDFPTVSQPENGKVNEIKIIENNLRNNEKVNVNALPLNGDKIRQREAGKIGSFALEQNFDAMQKSEGGGFTPPDPTGAAGPNHYVNAVNVAIKIFDKSGNVLAGPTDLGSFLGNGSNSGDPIIIYDHLADRFFVSQFQTSNDALIIGISETPDPTGAYNVYEFPLDAFPDYPHYSIWPDGYYLTANKFAGNTTYVIERDVMLAGDPNPQIIGFNLPGVVNNPNTVFSPEPANLIGTSFPVDVPGYIVYLQDDGWGGISNDHLKIWEIDVDWGNPNASTISSPLEVPTAPFESTFAPFGSGDVNQPGTSQKIDMIGGVISYAANYRSFGSYNSWLVTFNVDVDGNDTSGVRWIELRNDSSNDWSIYQEGTYAPADGHSRYMGSAAMDAAGNIALGFNIASATLPAGIRYTGRYDGDPLGEMTVAETTIVDGVGVQTTSNRFGDYSHLSMDPDNFTFWHTAEYFSSNNNWVSRVASFTLSGGFANDVGINNIIQPENGILTENETVEVSIRNFGQSTQTSIPLELRLDGNLVATETYNGSIDQNNTATYTFSQTLDLSNPGQTYTIEVNTLLASDEFNNNDAYIKEVTHLLATDVGAVDILSPQTGEGLGMETVSVSLQNFGANPQSNFSVQYSINGGTPVVETFSGTLASEDVSTFTFSQPADLSDLGDYTITVSTDLTGDMEPTNDEVEIEVSNLLCQPTMNCSSGDGLELFQLEEINNPSGCEGYGDFTDLVTTLDPGETYELTVTTGYGNQFLNVWIDFNDDYILTQDELVINNHEIADGQGAGTYTETLDFTIPAGAEIGLHLMRAKTNWNSPVPNDSCEETTYGETEDYSVIIGMLGVEDRAFQNSGLVVTTKDNKNFAITLNTSYNGELYAAVYNMLGQQLKFKDLAKSSASSYEINLDMSQASAGVYIVKIASPNLKTFKATKLIVE